MSLSQSHFDVLVVCVCVCVYIYLHMYVLKDWDRGKCLMTIAACDGECISDQLIGASAHVTNCLHVMLELQGFGLTKPVRELNYWYFQSRFCLVLQGQLVWIVYTCLCEWGYVYVWLCVCDCVCVTVCVSLCVWSWENEMPAAQRWGIFMWGWMKQFFSSFYNHVPFNKINRKEHFDEHVHYFTCKSCVFFSVYSWVVQ